MGMGMGMGRNNGFMFCCRFDRTLDNTPFEECDTIFENNSETKDEKLLVNMTSVTAFFTALKSGSWAGGGGKGY
jgi:hypothetical protein